MSDDRGRVVRLKLDSKFMAERLLHLPKGANVINARAMPEYLNMIELVVSHPDLPELEDGMRIPEANPTLRHNPAGDIEFLSWNIDGLRPTPMEKWIGDDPMDLTRKMCR